MPDELRRSDRPVWPRLKAALLTGVVVICFPVIGSALYLSSAYLTLRGRLGRPFPRLGGFLFASAWAAVATIAACRFFPAHLLPRIGDLYLLGIVLTAYRFPWRPAVYLFVLALALAAWVRAPASDLSWLASFAVISLCSIAVIARLKPQPRSPG